jgi:hypothetical protein
MAKMDVMLCFDVEDYFHPPEVGSDAIIKECADALKAEGVRGNFFFIGVRARLLRQRGCADVFEALKYHEVGLHTITGEHPCLPEYCAGKDWWDGVAAARDHESRGCQMIRDAFGYDPCCLSQHAAYAAPHVFPVAREMGLPYVYGPPAAAPLYNLSWYCGALNLPYAPMKSRPVAYFEPGDASYSHPLVFERAMARLKAHVEACIEQRQPYMTIFLCHPYHLRVVDFVDFFMHTSGINVPPAEWASRPQPRLRTAAQMELVWVNMRILVRYLERHDAVNIVTVPEVQAKYGHQPVSISRVELFSAAQEVAGTHFDGLLPEIWEERPLQIPSSSRFSPAEYVVGLVESILHYRQTGGLPASTPRAEVLGPMENPITTPEIFDLDWESFVSLCGQFREFVDRHGHLPHNLGPKGARIGLGSFYRAVAETYGQITRSGAPATVHLHYFPRVPEEAVAIGHAYQDIIDQAMIDPALDTSRLVHYGRLQAWTLKPAFARDSWDLHDQ